MDRSYKDGLPYYCKQCGVGLGEFMACESGNCELESVEDAQQRKLELDAAIDAAGGERK